MNGSYIASRVLGAVAVALVGLMFSKCARALSTITPAGGAAVEYVQGGVKLVNGGIGFASNGTPTWVAPATVSGTASVTQPLAAQIGGRSLVIGGLRTVGAVALGSAAAIAYAGYTGWEIGTAISDYMRRDDADGGTRMVPCGGSWCFDAGAVPGGGGTGTLYCFNGPGCPATSDATRWFPTRLEACQAADNTNWGFVLGQTLSGSPGGGGNGRYVSGVSVNGGGSCVGTFNYPGGTSGVTAGTVTGTGPLPLTCAPYVDFHNPAYSNSSPVPGADGKCPTGVYSTPLTVEQAAAKLAVGSNFPGTVDLTKADDVAKDILARGYSIPGASDYSTSGPASITGTPTVTTTNLPGGGTKTETKTPTTNYTYAGDTITYNTTSVTVINNAGDVTTITESEPGAEQEPESVCTKNPGTLGCMKPGEPPTEAPTWQTRTVDYAPENLGFGAGSCPAPVHWELPISGVQLDWGYEPICDVAPLIRLAFLLLATIGAAFIIVKETSS